MTRKALTICIAILVLAGLGGGAYYYYGMLGGIATTNLPPAAVPDNSVNAGVIQALSGTSITIKKQDGTVVNFAIASTTRITIEAGQADAGASALAAGKVVLITPSSADPKTAGSIIVTSEPPAQP